MRHVGRVIAEWNVVVLCVGVLLLGAGFYLRTTGFNAGYEAAARATEERAVAARKPALQAAYDRGYGEGTTEGVARVLGGYKSGKCRLVTDLPRTKLTGQPAPVTDCVAVSWQNRSGVFIADHGPTPTPETKG